MFDWFKGWLEDRKIRKQQDGMSQVNIATGKTTPVPETDGGKLFRSIAKGLCPDCDNEGFFVGPSGGMSQNIYCVNADCRSAFNVTEMLGIAERIGKAPDHVYAEKDANG